MLKISTISNIRVFYDQRRKKQQKSGSPSSIRKVIKIKSFFRRHLTSSLSPSSDIDETLDSGKGVKHNVWLAGEQKVIIVMGKNVDHFGSLDGVVIVI